MGTKKLRSRFASGFFGLASIKDAQYGCGDGISEQKGLSAILRSDTQNDAVCRRRNGGHRPRQFASLVFTKQNYTNIGNVDALATKQTRGQRAELVRFKSHLLIKVKKKNSAIPYGITELFLVAEMGFEPHDLRVMSPASYQTAPLRDIKFGIRRVIAVR